MAYSKGKSAGPLGTANTLKGHVGGLGHKGYVVDTKPDMEEITPRKAQTNKFNYKIKKQERMGN